MWRSFFLALGVYVCILGVEALALERAVLKPGIATNGNSGAQREIVPPDWAPWSLLAGGAVVALYSFTLPQKLGGGG
jgi:hypothetical protein